MRIPLKKKMGLSVTALVCGTLLGASCSHKMAPEGHYQDVAVVADGSADEWAQPLRFSNESYTLQFNVTNDNKNVYVCVISRDYATQLRILRAGMSVCFDPKGEKSRDMSIVFPIRKQQDPDSYRNRNGNPITSDTKSRKEELLLQSDYYNTTGFLNLENGQFSVGDQKSNIRVAMKLNNGDSILVYEAIVPIRDILGADLNPRAAQKNFSVGIVLNAVPAQGGRGGGGGRPGFGGMRGGMMGGMRGGMMGGGGRGGSGRGEATKEEADWYQFRLAASTHPGK
jgi:hypothetical protein